MMHLFPTRYGTGFGLVEPVLGKDSPLNVPNSIFGIILYSVMILIGKNNYLHMLQICPSADIIFTFMSCDIFLNL